MNPLLAHWEQYGTRPLYGVRQRIFRHSALSRVVLRRTGYVQDVSPLEIAAFGHPVVTHHQCSVVAQQFS